MILWIVFMFYWISVGLHLKARRDIKTINLALQDDLRKRGEGLRRKRLSF